MRRLSYRILRLAVRGRRQQGGPRGEAVLAEFDHITGNRAALRWAAGGLRVALCERYAARRAVYRVAIVALAAVAATPLLGTVRFTPSSGMEPTLAVGSHHLVDEVVFQLTGIDRGDIVVHPLPDSPEHSAPHRVIGLAGDRIECRDGLVFRDGGTLDEPYLSSSDQVIGTDCAATTVPEGALYLLGDHREAARDSRHWGVIRADSVTGRVVV